MDYAIKIRRIYNDVELKSHYKIASKSKIEKLITEYSTNPINLQDEIRNEERFLRYPEVTVEQHAPISHPNNNNCLILATVTATYTVVAAVTESTNVFPLILGTICVLIIVFAIFVLQLAEQSHEKSMIENACYLYTKNGVPDMIQINGNEYHLDTDGKIEGMDRIFLNPYDEVDLAKADCIRVNTKE